MSELTVPRSPRVFLSYSHDSAEHKDRVLALCDRLRADGINAWIDQYEIAPQEGWPRWCIRQVEEADFVLAICTEIYERRFRGAEEPVQGLGVHWEGYVVTQKLYDTGARNTKFVPVLFPPSALTNIPTALRGASCYDASRDEDYWSLYRHLSGQPATTAPALGTLVSRPPRKRLTESFTTVPEPRYEDDRAQRLGKEIIAARLRLKELTIAGRNTDDVREQILRLRREMREGGRLQAGDCLCDSRFQLLEIIGRGGFATVWKAWDEERQELVAVKVLHGLHAEDRSRRERFFRGASQMAELHHPGVVRVIESHLTDGGYHFFVMEHVAGGDLEKAVLSGRLRPKDALLVISTVGEALAFAHEKGVIHRDVKPANILLDGVRPKLTDFDLVRAFDTTGGTQTQQGLGTFLYTAPEVLTDAKEAENTADVYSLAMTTVFGLSGKRLPLRVLRDTDVYIAELPCANAQKEILRRAVSWEPKERPTLTELCEALRHKATHAIARKLEPQPGEKRIHAEDGTILVYVPGGEYILGSADLSLREQPIHRVVLSPFWIGKYPVTNEQYYWYLQTNLEAARPEYSADQRFNGPQHPVVGVSWHEAKAYCAWAGLMLPSEAQWEAAARGTDQRRFPWGNNEPTSEHANFGQHEGRTTPVDMYPKGAGFFGTLDQGGNIWEWCEDEWSPDAYRHRDGKIDPVITSGNRAVRALHGGSWVLEARYLAAAFRYWRTVSDRIEVIGFRCVLPA
jgi:formylglycine-generating enzyme required for sulfatase activity